MNRAMRDSIGRSNEFKENHVYAKFSGSDTARSLSGIGPDSWLPLIFTVRSEVSPSNNFSGIGPDSCRLTLIFTV